MHFHTVTIGELKDFGASELFQRLNQLPITVARILSQASNPRAQPGQVALVIAYSDNFDLLGYIGALPDTIYFGEQTIPMAWNSCWWVHPQKGKVAAMRLFSMLLKSWQGTICFADLPMKSKAFIEATHNYNLQTLVGYRFFLRVYFYSRLCQRAKLPKYFPVGSILKGCDSVINLCLSAIQNCLIRPLSEVSVDADNFFSNEALHFISQQDNANISLRGESEFRWITDYPWVISDKDKGFDCRPYYFSYTAQNFEQKYLEFKIGERLVAVAMLTVRDGHYRVSYYYGIEEVATAVSKQLWVWLIQHGALSFLVSHPDLVKPRRVFLHIWKKRIITHAAFPKMFGDLPRKLFIQAGDGDAVFT